jgi:hypothetical protein
MQTKGARVQIEVVKLAIRGLDFEHLIKKKQITLKYYNNKITFEIFVGQVDVVSTFLITLIFKFDCLFFSNLFF